MEIREKFKNAMLQNASIALLIGVAIISIYFIVQVNFQSSVEMASDFKVNLTEEEKAWIQDHPLIKLGGDPTFAPFEFYDDGLYQGMAPDYIELIKKRTGLNIKIQPESTWQKVMIKLKSRELDIAGAIGITSERQKFLIYSDPYTRFKRMILMRSDAPPISSLDDLKGKLIGVQDLSSHHGFMVDIAPDQPLKTYTGVEDVLIGLSTGEVDAVVGNAVVSVFQSRNLGLVNIKVAAPASEDDYTIHLAGRDDWPELIAIINKGLASITPEEKTSIRNRWTAGETIVDYELMWRTLLFLLPVLLMSLIWVAHARRQQSRLRVAENNQRLAAEEALAANRAKSTFLATMSHEIRTPMNGIVGMVDLLAESGLNDYQKNLLKTVRSSSFVLLEVIDDILDYSKIEAGKMELEFVPFSIRDIVEHVSVTMGRVALDKSVELLMYVDPEINQHYIGDPTRVRQILFNLIGNAVKFSARKDGVIGRVVIKTELIKENKVDGKGSVTVHFSVTDNGIGIEEESQKTLFLPFTQAASSTTRKFGGTGLGLSICTQLLNLMNSELELDSKFGEGAKFHFKLDFEVASEDDQPLHGEAELEDCAILIDSSDAEFVGFIKSYLTSKKASVIVKTKNRSLREYSKELLDIDGRLPVIIFDERRDYSNFEALRKQLLKDYPGKNVRYMILTGNESFSSIEGYNDSITLFSVPLERSAFIHNVAVCIGRASPEIEESIDPATNLILQDISKEKAEERGELVLIVDDNETNRLVMSEQLHKLGFASDVAEDGAEAFEMLLKKQYGLLLTDCHMPIMDGYELTRKIRQMTTKTRDIPIVAITANALKGASDKCYAVGMNDFVVKPVALTVMKNTLIRFLPQALERVVDPDSNANELTVANDEDEVKRQLLFNPEVMVDLVGDNEEMHKELVNLFLTELPDTIAQLKECYENGKIEMLMNEAHRFKSTANSVGAAKVGQLFNEAESFLRKKINVGHKDMDTDISEKLGLLLSQIDVAVAETTPLMEAFLANE